MDSGGARRALIEPRLRDMDRDAAPPPLLIVLHDAGQRPRKIREIARFSDMAPGWTVAYPEGLERTWSVGRKGVGGGYVRKNDDVAFLVRLVETLAEDGRADPRRVFVAGFGEGGMMALRLGCETRRLVRGMAVVMAGWPASMTCRFPAPIPAIHFNGKRDPFHPWAGGQVRPEWRQGAGIAASIDRAMTNAARRNGCAGFQQARRPGGLLLRIWSACRAPLIQWVALEGGHHWPGAPAPPRREIRRLKPAPDPGPPVPAPDATALIRRLFESLAALQPPW